MKANIRFLRVLFIFLIIFLPFVSQANELSQPVYEVKVEIDVKVPMRDGVNGIK